MKIAVIGAGAAGLMAACRLGDAGIPATVYERNDRVGRKLAITGKGRCNLTNDAGAEEVLASIPTNPRFLYGAMNFFPPSAVMSYFENDLGLPLKTERGNRVFPASDKARDVVDVLKSHALGKKTRFVYEKVLEILQNGAGGFSVSTASGKRDFDAVILCTGGRSYSATGSDGYGYKLAKDLGHHVTPVRPSLVPLVVREKNCAEMQGLSLRNAALTVTEGPNGKKIYEDFGEMLFTHFGVSGPMILSASAHMLDMAPGKYVLHLDLKPALDPQTLDKRLLSDFEKYKNRDFANALSDLLPAKMIPVVVALSGVAERKKVNAVTKEERRRLCALLKDLPLTVEGFRPIEEAIVTSGGVNVKEVDPKTMESRLVPGLFFAGEILDVDAYTGGFNLQIAFASAALAARAIAGRAQPENRIERNTTETENRRMNIAIDGPSGAGKSSLAKGIAKHYGIVYVDTGALYRTVGLYALRQGVALENVKEICKYLPDLEVTMRHEGDGQHVYLFDEDVSSLIRTPEISMYASAVSALPEVRAFLLDTQRSIAKKTSVVMDGRDIGTVILPDADVKIFLVANDAKRAARRCEELRAKGIETSVEEVLADMRTRDENDKSREAAPAIPAEDAIFLDNSDIDLEQTIDAAIAIIEEKLKK